MITVNSKRICKIGLSAAMLAVCAQITVPAPIPFTLQTFAVFLSARLLGTADAFFAMGIYLLSGAVGMPVFSGFRGGLGVLTGATGGYIIGMAAVPAVMRPSKNSTRAVRGICAAAAVLLCYTIGTAWYAVGYTNGISDMRHALSVCVLPFILPDAVKIYLAFVTADRLERAHRP